MSTAVIFDLDGTLLYTLEDLYLSVNVMLEKFGYPLRTKDEVCSFIGNGVPKLVERSLPHGTNAREFESALAFFKEYYDMHCRDNTCAYDGVIDALSELKRGGYALGVVTNKVHSATEILCREHFGGLIDAAQGQLPELLPKPDPASIHLVMNALGTDRAIYVGDSEVDIESARNAGLPCISVTWGYKDKDFLIESGAQYIAENMQQMLDCIYEICNK